jgi:hypothetical protein
MAKGGKEDGPEVVEKPSEGRESGGKELILLLFFGETFAREDRKLQVLYLKQIHCYRPSMKVKSILRARLQTFQIRNLVNRS